jgi:hypothetical protein
MCSNILVSLSEAEKVEELGSSLSCDGRAPAFLTFIKRQRLDGRVVLCLKHSLVKKKAAEQD